MANSAELSLFSEPSYNNLDSPTLTGHKRVTSRDVHLHRVAEKLSAEEWQMPKGASSVQFALRGDGGVALELSAGTLVMSRRALLLIRGTLRQTRGA